MLNNWNTMENANLLERKLLRRVDELPIGTVIYGLDNLNEVNLWVVNKRYGDVVYLYNLSSYGEKTFVVKVDNKEVSFKDTEDIQVVKEYFKNKTYNLVGINLAKDNIIGNDLATTEPNTSRFYFNTYPISTKSKKVEVKVEIVDTKNWYTRIPYNTYVLPAFNSDLSKYYLNKVKRMQQIAKNIHSDLKYRFKNPNEYEVCNYLIYSKDSHEDKLKMLDKLQYLPIYNYNVTDVHYNTYDDKLTVRIDDIKIDLNADIDVLDETVRLLDLQECRHCKCDSCKYYNGRTCIKNVQVLRNSTPCNSYSPNKQYKIFEREWNKASTEATQGYLNFVRKYSDNERTIISKEDNVTYFTDDTVFDRKPNEIVKAKYKETYYPRRKKNKFVIEEI